MSTIQEHDRSVDEVTRASGIDARLIRAVIRQTGKENLRSITERGADGGYAGFTYYSDTVPFFKRNRALIVALVEQQAQDLGELPVDMVCGFQCLAGREMDKSRGLGFEDDVKRTRENRLKMAEYIPSVSRCLYGAPLTDDDTQVSNALAWFAAEEVARAFHQDL